MSTEQEEELSREKAASLRVLVIDRSRWYRGRGAAESALRRPDGTMCCLGFLGEACGIPGDELLNEGEPLGVNGLYSWPAWVFNDAFSRNQTPAVESLIVINDRNDLPEPERERAIARIFAEHGVAVTFTDGTP